MADQRRRRLSLKRQMQETMAAHRRRAHGGRMSKEQTAQASWRLLMKVAEKHMDKAGARLMQMGLSPVMGHFLDELARMEPGPMSQLVARMDVDPGWVTDIVDRLEARGDVVRKSSPDDRRVKILELTDKGRESWRAMDDAIFMAPPELIELRDGELRLLLRIAQRLAAEADVDVEARS
jgi:MarR family transcriptional regulator, organic hydroperoxide resistance regulator